MRGLIWGLESDLGSEKPDLETERSDLGSERPDLGSERPGLGIRGGQTDRNRRKLPYVES